MRRVLLTGGTGFVGANLTRHLLRDGHQVHLLVRRGHAPWRLADVARAVTWHEVALDDEGAVQALLADLRPQWVFHLAAHGAYSWQTDLSEMIRTNVLGTANLLRAALAAGAEAFVHAGSSSEYGFKDHAPREDEALEPNSHYAVTKAAASLLCRHAGMREGAPVVTLRLYSVYGPWEEPGRLVPTLLSHALAGRLPTLAAPDTARDYVFTADVCEAFVRAAHAAPRCAGAVFNVGTGRQTTLREIVQEVRALCPGTPTPVWGSMPGRRWDTTVWVSDPSAIGDALGWQARRTLAEGLRETLEWLRHTPAARARYEGGG